MPERPSTGSTLSEHGSWVVQWAARLPSTRHWGPGVRGGLALIAPAISGAPRPGLLDEHAARLDEAIDAAIAAGDLDMVNRPSDATDSALWPNGPVQPKPRFQRDGSCNERGHPFQRGRRRRGNSGIDAWLRLASVTVPTTVMWGELDVPLIVERSRTLSERLPVASSCVIANAAHLPYLERPAVVTGSESAETIMRRRPPAKQGLLWTAAQGQPPEPAASFEIRPAIRTPHSAGGSSVVCSGPAWSTSPWRSGAAGRMRLMFVADVIPNEFASNRRVPQRADDQWFSPAELPPDLLPYARVWLAHAAAGRSQVTQR